MNPQEAYNSTPNQNNTDKPEVLSQLKKLYETFKMFYDNDGIKFSENNLVRKDMLNTAIKLENMLFLEIKDKLKLSLKRPYIQRTAAYRLSAAGESFFADIEEYGKNQAKTFADVMHYFNVSIKERIHHEKIKYDAIIDSINSNDDMDSPDIASLKEKLKDIEQKRSQNNI